jgi:hypothetical protein
VRDEHTPPDVAWLTATSGKQLCAVAEGAQHGLFTLACLKGLAGEAYTDGNGATSLD